MADEKLPGEATEQEPMPEPGQTDEGEKLLRELLDVLSTQCGRTGENEGAVDTLKRIINERDKVVIASLPEIQIQVGVVADLLPVNTKVEAVPIMGGTHRSQTGLMIPFQMYLKKDGRGIELQFLHDGKPCFPMVEFNTHRMGEEGMRLLGIQGQKAFFEQKVHTLEQERLAKLKETDDQESDNE
jgi:hypothetical protein